MTQEERDKLQEKLARKMRQYENLMEMVRDLGQEWAEVDKDPETIRLRELYAEKKAIMRDLAAQAEKLSLQAKEMKKDIDAMIDQLGGKRQRKQGNNNKQNN